MKIDSLPLKKLDWKKLVPAIGEAREALARLDEKTRDLPASQFGRARLKEAMALVHSKSREKILLAEEGLAAATRMAKPFTPAAWCKIHAIVKRDGPNPDEIGKIRTRQNWIGPEGSPIEEAYFFPPPPTEIQKHLRALERYLAMDDLDPVVQLAIGFAQFLAIHPFMDGNGRVARILVPRFAVKKKLLRHPILFLSAYIEKTRDIYIKRLFEITEENHWEEWILYFLKAVTESA
jgi:Fic family protein